MSKELGNALWRLLHVYAFHYPSKPSADDMERASKWLAEFTLIVAEQSTGCACSRHWQELLSKWPCPLHSREAFYWWTCQAHDWVNERLGKARMWPQLARLS
jgi:FAD-linked sulfhydryl oxidase